MAQLQAQAAVRPLTEEQEFELSQLHDSHEVRGWLIRKYVEASVVGEDVEPIRTRIAEFNEQYPDARITYATLRKAELPQRKFLRMLDSGRHKFLQRKLQRELDNAPREPVPALARRLGLIQ